MQNILSSSPVLSTANATEFAHAMPSAVVKNDTATPSRPSIKLNSLSVPVTVTVGSTSTAVSQNKLVVMEQERKSWETTELAASNKRLYSILKDAYSYYLVLKQDSNKNVRKALTEELEQFIKQRQYTFMPSTHDMTRVVKSVFGLDRRRVSAYSLALREALRQEIAAVDLIAFIEENGGVEQIRMGGSKPLSVTMRAAKVEQQVLDTELGIFKFDSALFMPDADWVDQQVVIVATYLPTGEFQTNAVIRHDSAVNAALAALYSQQQANLRKDAQADREAEAQQVADLKKAAAKAKAAIAKNIPPLSTEEKQKIKAAKEGLATAQFAANKESLNSLLVNDLA